MRTLLSALAIVAFAVVPAYAISLSSPISEWEAAGLIHTDLAYDGGVIDLQKWGVTVQDSKLYAIVLNGASLRGAESPYDNFFPGVWINADRNASTQIAHATDADQPVGTDVCAEYDTNGPINEVAWWGVGHDNWNYDLASNVERLFSTTTNTDDTFAMSIPWYTLKDKVAAYNTDALTGYGYDMTLGVPFEATVRLAGHLSSGGAWAGDVGSAVTLAPEPGTITMIVTGLALLGYALRRRS